MAVVFVGNDEPGGAQCAEMLANRAGGNLERYREFVRGDFAMAFEHFEHVTLGRRQFYEVRHIIGLYQNIEVVAVAQAASCKS
jgi:hypothetical protein